MFMKWNFSFTIYNLKKKENQKKMKCDKFVSTLGLKNVCYFPEIFSILPSLPWLQHHWPAIGDLLTVASQWRSSVHWSRHNRMQLIKKIINKNMKKIGTPFQFCSWSWMLNDTLSVRSNGVDYNFSGSYHLD